MKRIVTPSPFAAHAAAALLALAAVPASAAWTVTENGAPSGCTHVISDGNWQIGVYKYSDDNWNLGKYSGANGSGYVAGSGDLDLTGVAADCGVVIKASNNGALEQIAGLTSIVFPDSLETMYGNMVAGCKALTNAVVGSGIRSMGQQVFYDCSSLKTVTLPEGCPGLTKLGNAAFRMCKNLETPLDFSKSVFTELPTYALVDLQKVMEIRLPETVTTLGDESLRYHAGPRAIWFYGPPPTSIAGTALEPKTSPVSSWVLVAARKHAAEWKADERVLPFEGTEQETAVAAAKALGLTGVKPVGKWTTGTNGTKHWVVEELPAETMLLLK
jgi:hypothetical protein